MKRYVYLTKEDGLVIANNIMAENRLEVKEKTRVCIDNIYSMDLIRNVNNWLEKNGKELLFCENFEVAIFYNDKLHYITTFVEFRNIVSEYRER